MELLQLLLEFLEPVLTELLCWVLCKAVILARDTAVWLWSAASAVIEDWMR